MEWNISDLLDGINAPGYDMDSAQAVSAERVKEIVMAQIHNETKAKHLKRPLILALAAALALSAAALATVRWNGFAAVGGLNDAEVGRLLDEASHTTAGASESADGTVHYFDEHGDEYLTLSAEEARRYEEDRIAAHDRAVRESTALIDADTMELLPSGISEVPVATNGEVEDFLLGNGHLALFHPDGGGYFALDAGETVTLSLDADEACILEFNVFRDGVCVLSENAWQQAHMFTYEADKAGSYSFGVMYYSAAADRFRSVSLTIG